MLRVEPADVSEQWAVLSLVGPTPKAPCCPPLGSRPRRRPTRSRDWTPASSAACLRSATAARRCSTWSSPGPRWAPSRTGCSPPVPPRPASGRTTRCGWRPGVRLGVDSDHRTIPNEMSWLTTAVHLDKGLPRPGDRRAVHNLGRPPRRLVLLHLDGVSEVLAEPGTPVLAGAREVGRVGGVVRHYELGVIALALVKQSVAADAALTVAGSTASIDPDDSGGRGRRGEKRCPRARAGRAGLRRSAGDRQRSSPSRPPGGNAEGRRPGAAGHRRGDRGDGAGLPGRGRLGGPPAHPGRRDAAHPRPRLCARGRGRCAESTDLVVQLSSGGAVTDPFDARLAVLEAQPDAASLTLGTVNFGRDVFSNPWDLIVELHTQMQQRGIVPSTRCSTSAAGHARPAARPYGPPHGGRARRPGDGRARRHAGDGAGAGPRACRSCPMAPRSRPPGSAGRRCR